MKRFVITSLALAGTSLLAFVLLGVLGCATPAVSPESEVPLTQEELCLSIMTAVCNRVDECGFADRVECLAANAPYCPRMTGLTLGEAETCVTAVREMACLARMPNACGGVGEDASMPEAPEVPQPKTLGA